MNKECLQLSPAEVGGRVGRVAVEALSVGGGLVGPGEWYSPFSLGCTNVTLHTCICQVGKHCLSRPVPQGMPLLG